MGKKPIRFNDPRRMKPWGAPPPRPGGDTAVPIGGSATPMPGTLPGTVDPDMPLMLPPPGSLDPNKRPGGRYVPGGYDPIAEDAKWGGEGYSGPDPREASAALEPDVGAPPPGGGQGGKGSGQLNQAGEAGFTPPGGGQGGKSGGSGDVVEPQPAPGTPLVPDTQPVVEGNTIPGQGGNTVADPGAGDFQFDDTGGYTTPQGAFDPEYDQSDRDPADLSAGNKDAQARIKAFTDQQKAAWAAAGGSPGDFQQFNPAKGSFKDFAQGPERHAARLAARKKFYADQIARLGG